MSDSRTVLARDTSRLVVQLVLVVLALLAGTIIGEGTVPGFQEHRGHGPTLFTTYSIRGTQ